MVLICPARKDRSLLHNLTRRVIAFQPHFRAPLGMGEVSKTRSDESLTSFSSASLPCVQSLSSTRSLSVALEPSLLRGVPLHQALSRWGRHWVSSEATHAYELSRQTARLDNFLSHDWHTSGWKKFLALLVLFNSRAAAIASTGMTMLLAILQSASIVPDGVWVTCSGYATFALVFLFWQRLRALVRPRVVFLDKLCIAQHDPMLKERAILGLAAFLDSSDNLTVLWSPAYFRRLQLGGVQRFLRGRAARCCCFFASFLVFHDS